jgi:hypothetical protein
MDPGPFRTPLRLRGSPAGVLLFAGATLAGLLCLASLGHDEAGPRLISAINAVVLSLHAGLLAALYVLAGVGMGRPLVALLRRVPGARADTSSVGWTWLQAPLGVGVLLWCSHAAGMLGWLSGPKASIVSWALLGVGLLLLGDQVVRGSLRPERWRPLPVGAVIAAPGLAAILAAACSPPGALWLGAASEGGGYDVLSYHLQLPKEWIAPGGRLWPVEHNVYSFLPSYMEAAYLHIGAMVGGGRPDGGAFVAGTGLGVIATQLLHAWLGVLTALLVGRAVSLLRGPDQSPRTMPAIAGGACVLCVPWVMVVGSLSYNELGVTAMLVGALLASLERGWSPPARALAVGLLMGLACSIKPTSLFLAAPLAGVFLLFALPATWRARGAMCAAGSLAALGAMMPWLARNWMASGNPVFPFGARFFGTSHWSGEQMARYAGAHAFQGTLTDRLSLLFGAERGVFHEQWAILFPLGVLSLAALLGVQRTRRAGAMLGAGLAMMLLAWLFLTHLQSRFLLSCVVPLGVAGGLGMGLLLDTLVARSRSTTRLALLVCALAPVSMGAWSWLIYASQRAGHPNQLLAIGGVETLTGQWYAPQLAELRPPDRTRALLDLPPTPFVNFTLPPDRAIYLIGGAAPLYLIPGGGTHAIVYHTTWDRNPLGDAIRTHPDDLPAWTAAIRDASRGLPVDFVLVDFDELARLSRSAWFDPDVTPERLSRWLQQECEVVRGWPTGERSGTFLFRIKAPGATGAPR